MKCQQCPVDGPCYSERPGFSGMCKTVSVNPAYAKIVQDLSSGARAEPETVVIDSEAMERLRNGESLPDILSTGQRRSVQFGSDSGGCGCS